MKLDHFTYTDFAKAGPLFHAESSVRRMAEQALRYRKQAQVALDKRDELLGELYSAQSYAKLRSRILSNARTDGGVNRAVARSLPRLLPASHDVDNKHLCRDLELAVLSAHDRLWAAQRGVAMWNHVYGDLV
jgi:hypothetical protein